MSEPVSNLDKCKEAAREAAMRRALYPRWVEQGKLAAQEAVRRIAIIEAIEADYLALAEQDEAEERLL